MNPAVLLVISVLFAVTYNLLSHGFKNKGLRGMGDILFYNSILSAVWIIIMLFLNHGSAISKEAWLWGIVYGIVNASFLLFKMQALATGPVSITSFTGCSSLILSTAFGVTYFKEKVSVLQIIGVIALIFALFLTITGETKKTDDNKKVSKIWYVWCLLFFLSSGATGIIFKLHQSSPFKNEVNQMMLAASITSMLSFLITSVIVQKKTDKTLPHVKSPALIFALICGIMSCGYNRLNITLTGLLPSIVFFPVFNGSVILFATLSAAVIFREKVTKLQIFGLVIGFLALIMTAGIFNI